MSEARRNTATVTVYGIPNCDQVKKARAWLTAEGVAHTFVDFKKAGLAQPLAARWLQQLDWQVLVNRKGTTWRALPEDRKAAVQTADDALALMLEAPSIVKRPVLETGDVLLAGFDPARYATLFISTSN